MSFLIIEKQLFIETYARRELSADLLELPLSLRAEMALKEAARKVVEEHRHLGVPLHLWRDGGLVEVSAEEVQKELANQK